MRRSRYQKWEKNGLHYVEGGGRKIFETHVDQTTFFSLSLSSLSTGITVCFLIVSAFSFFFLTQYVEKNGTKEHKRNGSKKKKKRKKVREREKEREKGTKWKKVKETGGKLKERRVG